MHRFQSQSTIIRLKFAAFFICLRWILVPTSAGVLIYSLVRHDIRMTWIAMGLGAATLLVVFTHWVLASKTRCPLCMTPVLATKQCAKHRHAKTALGSHRLRVALAVLIKGRFYCPYCNEPSMLQVRQRGVEAPGRQLQARVRGR